MGIHGPSHTLDELAADPESLDQIMVAIKYDELKDIVMGEISELFRETTDEFMVTRIPPVETCCCLGTACCRCQMQCPETVFDYASLTIKA
ncbi:MAG: hypothetical protein WCY65_03280 [Candidatus Methanomethylophilaceae archaeon]